MFDDSDIQEFLFGNIDDLEDKKQLLVYLPESLYRKLEVVNVKYIKKDINRKRGNLSILVRLAIKRFIDDLEKKSLL